MSRNKSFFQPYGKGFSTRWAYGGYIIKDVVDGFWVSQGDKYFRKLKTLEEAKQWIRDKEGASFGK